MRTESHNYRGVEARRNAQRFEGRAVARFSLLSTRRDFPETNSRIEPMNDHRSSVAVPAAGWAASRRPKGQTSETLVEPTGETSALQVGRAVPARRIASMARQRRLAGRARRAEDSASLPSREGSRVPCARFNRGNLSPLRGEGGENPGLVNSSASPRLRGSTNS
jgi:hypothetical protein